MYSPLNHYRLPQIVSFTSIPESIRVVALSIEVCMCISIVTKHSVLRLNGSCLKPMGIAFKIEATNV